MAHTDHWQAHQEPAARIESDRIRSLMAVDVKIFESGNFESSLWEHAGHHLESDMAFMGAVKSELFAREVIDTGELATVLARYRRQGDFREQDIDPVTTEIRVLKRLNGQREIVHDHWFSS
jgi:hypothetical protein